MKYCTSKNILYLVGEFKKKEWGYIMESINPVELSSTESQISESVRPKEMAKYVKDELTGNDTEKD